MPQDFTTLQVALTPHGDVLFSNSGADWLESEDWLSGLFHLAARKADVSASPAARFWQDYSERFLTELCHVPESAESYAIAAPSEADLGSTILTAPPMRGGEYLSPAVLLQIWQAFNGWVHSQAPSGSSLGEFLRRSAPKWQQVGRVCFHLAENKAQPERPFAFMATYAVGLNKQGQLRHQPLRSALEQYAGQSNRQALVRLLSPVHRASECCGWLKELVDSGQIYRPIAWSPGQAYRLLTSAPELQDAGLTLRLPDWWKKRPRPQVKVTIGKNKKAALGANETLDFDLELAVGDQMLSEAEWDALMCGDDGLVLVKGKWVEVNRERLQQAREHWERLRAEGVEEGIDFVWAMRLLAGASEDLRHETTMDEEREWSFVQAGDSLREILDSLLNPEALSGDGPPSELRASLRPYQLTGLTWLHILSSLGLGACLADDMGLGKTIQVLALLLKQKEADGRTPQPPSLLVVPASLMGNWKSETEKFAPALKMLFIHPSVTDRATLEKIAAKPQAQLPGVDLVITTYSMLHRQEWLLAQEWRNVILDEAQAIKTPSTRKARSAKQLKARARIALTGTPVENQLGDLWSLFDFLNPGLLGSQKVFQDFVKALENRKRDHYAPLRKLTGPYILRRLKTDKRIIKDLPDKTETNRYCSLTPKQARLYQQAVDALQTVLDEEEAGVMARRGAVLQALMRLKQVCNHPSQMNGDKTYHAADSGKFMRLAEICEEIAERQEKVLVFSQFREIIDPIEELLAGVFKRSGIVLHGGTSVKKRMQIVDTFQDDNGPPFMVLSLKAGGTGLNLTAASHVIHFDRWWNPAVENQATDRAFRIGQKRNVLVHKFIVQGTVEEKIDALIEGKKQLAEEVLSGEESVKWTEMSNEQILKLVQLDVSRAKW